MEPILTKLERMYSDMDTVYAAVADYYGFHCRGCEDNCCRTLFYHHTLAEYFYLIKGVARLDPLAGIRVKKQAKAVFKKTMAALKTGKTIRIWCPLNINDRCLLYGYRPMICRLHGIPYELRGLGAMATCHPGCQEFSDHYDKGTHKIFNRTPFYVALSNLEKELRLHIGFSKKIKITVSEMLIA